jgi:hypothetical protein
VNHRRQVSAVPVRAVPKLMCQTPMSSTAPKSRALIRRLASGRAQSERFAIIAVLVSHGYQLVTVPVCLSNAIATVAAKRKARSALHKEAGPRTDEVYSVIMGKTEPQDIQPATNCWL